MSEPLDIRHLRYFLAVAEAGSFSRAADRLGISQPSVSQQMRDLEAGLRVPLFQRRGKRILLTPRGLIFQEHARALLHQVENLLHELNGEPGELRGALQSGCNRFALSICRGKSGEAFINHQFGNSPESALIAMLDCVCGLIVPLRAATQFTQAQFHCGRPPPAALPRI